MTNYNDLNKSQLWQLVKERNLTGLTWQSSKTAMVEALQIVDSGMGTLDGNFKPTENQVNIPKNSCDNNTTNITLPVNQVNTLENQSHDNQPTLTKSDVITKSHSQSSTNQVNILENSCEQRSWQSTSHKPTELITQTVAPSDFSVWDEIISEVIETPTSETNYLEVGEAKNSDVVKEDVSSEAGTTNTSDNIVSRTQIFMWSYLDHEMAGSWKQLKDESEINRVMDFLDALLQLPKTHPNHCVIQFPVHNCSVSIKMKPRIVQEQDVNGRLLNRVDRQAQKNNLYANRNKTLMSTTESPGRNVGQPSVKESVLFKRARYIAQPIVISDPILQTPQYNFAGIDTISVNGRQVYPFSITSAYDETNVADKLVPTKILNKRKESATQRVETKGFYHVRGKIQNGLSPSFKDGKHNYCFQIDSQNRVSVWLLANDVQHVVSASDLIKGRKLQDVGFLEVQPYQYEEWQNLTMDLVVGGKEARLERFDWIRKELNKQFLNSDESVFQYLSEIKNKAGERLVITNLQVHNNRVSGELYGSQLLLIKRVVTRHKVVFHPAQQAQKNYVATAQTWLYSLPGKTLETIYGDNTKAPKYWDSVIGVNASNRMRVSDHKNGTKNRVRTEKDIKYINKLLTRFATDGIYSDASRTTYLGKLVKTDGSALTAEQIKRITDRVVNAFPIDKKLATLFTPSHASNVDEWKVSFLNLLKTYGQVTLAILDAGKLQQFNSDNTVLTDWCRGMVNYLRSMRVAVDVLTIGDSIELLKNAPVSPIKLVLLKVPQVALLNKHERLLHYVHDMVVTSKVETFKADVSKLTKPYANAVKEVRNNNGLD